jgi:hypothetical protein
MPSAARLKRHHRDHPDSPDTRHRVSPARSEAALVALDEHFIARESLRERRFSVPATEQLSPARAAALEIRPGQLRPVRDDGFTADWNSPDFPDT